jgi:hypothetical protein
VHIDPKAPADSPQHPRNWRRPQFLAPAAYTMDTTPPAAVLKPPAAPATPPVKAKKTAPKGKKPAAADLAAALAELGDA